MALGEHVRRSRTITLSKSSPTVPEQSFTKQLFALLEMTDKDKLRPTVFFKLRRVSAVLTGVQTPALTLSITLIKVNGEQKPTWPIQFP